MSIYRIRSTSWSDGQVVEQGSVEISKTMLDALLMLIVEYFWSYTEGEDQWIDLAEEAEQFIPPYRAVPLARAVRAVLAAVPPAPGEHLGLLLERMENRYAEVGDLLGILGGKQGVLERLAEVLEAGQVTIGSVEVRREPEPHGVVSNP